MEQLIRNRGHRDLLAALAGGAGYFLLAWGTIWLTSGSHNVSAIWPPNALLLAIVVPISMRRWPPYFAAAFLGNIVANYITFGSLVAPLLFGAINLSEVFLAAAMLRLLDTHDRPLENVRSMACFALFACLAPAVSALAGAATAHFVFGQPFWLSYRIWYLSDALGLLIFTPLFIGIRSGQMVNWLREIGRPGRIEVLAIFGLVILAALFVFQSSGYPLLFVMNAPILLASFRLGPFGTKISLITIAIVGIVYTTAGSGPIAALVPDRGDQALFLQFYLGVTLLSTLPVAAELNARRSLTRRLAESEASLRLLASESADALVRLDERGACLQSSGATTKLLGVETRSLIGSSLSDLVDPQHRAAVDSALREALNHPGTVAYCEFHPRDREDDWLECTLRALINQEGRAYGAIGAIRDITIRKEREVSLALAASSDSLTGALNHAAFVAHLDRALAHLTSTHLALIMVDVDHFKQVNDRHGHLAGDQVLVELHARLRALIRDQDVIGRLGGDELAILLDGAAEELAITIAEAIRTAVSDKPILLGEGEAPLAISISCGVAQAYPGIGREELTRRADDALYQAKGGGRGRVVISAT